MGQELVERPTVNLALRWDQICDIPLNLHNDFLRQGSVSHFRTGEREARLAQRYRKEQSKDLSYICLSPHAETSHSPLLTPE